MFEQQKFMKSVLIFLIYYICIFNLQAAKANKLRNKWLIKRDLYQRHFELIQSILNGYS